MIPVKEPMLPIEEQQKPRFDDRYFLAYRGNSQRESMYSAERDEIEKLRPEGGRILDVGCGLGLFLETFDPGRWERYGIDISDIAIAESRARGIRVNDYPQAYDYPDGFFDVIVFRGSIQLLPTPFATIERCVRLLAPGGWMIFLMVPNSNSPYYRRFKTLPFLTPHLNFLIPSDVMMKDALRNFGLEVLQIRYPYLGTPYANPLRDHVLYLLSFFGVERKFAFWRSMMQIFCRKPVARESES